MESTSIIIIIITSTLVIIIANLFVLGDNDFIECLCDQSRRSNLATDVIYAPDNASFASLMQAQNIRPALTSPIRPLLIITPIYDSEIQATIYCSKKLGVPIRIRSGGHDFEGLSYTSRTPFVVVDMRNFREISINSKDNTSWVRAGATLGQLYYKIAQTSRTLAFPAGVCPTVGVGGHFSGGGYGTMSRKHALAADSIIDAKIMNADGRILDRESMGEDLFWAIRGGGGTSFGIFLAFKVKLVTVPETVTVFNISRSLEQNATRLVYRWQYVADKIEESLTIRVSLRSVRSPRGGKKRTILATFTALFLGRAHDLLPLTQEKFPELGLAEQDCIEISWLESVLFMASLQDEPLDVLLSRTPLLNLVFLKGKSDYVREPIPMHALEGMWRFLHEEDEGLAEMQFSPYGGVLDTFSESETPFPHRSGNIFMIEYDVHWTEQGKTESERHMNWIRRLHSYMAPYVSKSPRAAYINYRDLDIGMNNEGDTSYEQASVWGFKYFKNNFDRLVRVKTMVDPSNFFRNEQSIPPLPSNFMIRNHKAQSA